MCQVAVKISGRFHQYLRSLLLVHLVITSFVTFPTMQFPTTIDKHTLYVTNLPFEVNEQQIRDEFQTVGNIKQVRLVTNRSGKSKGFAYVEYETEVRL